MSELSDQIRAIFAESRKTAEREPRQGISDAHGCVRAKVYSFKLFKETGAPAAFERPARWGLAAACGTAVGQFLEEASERLGHKAQVRASAGGISGTADIVLVLGEHVVDVKCLGGWKWRKIQHEPDPNNRRQVGTYAHILKKPKWALLYIDGRSIYTSGDEPDWILHEGLASEEHFLATSEFWAAVQGHVEAGTLPPRLEPDSFDCRVCAHNAVCWSL